MIQHYVLIDRRVVECVDLLQWAKWMDLSRKDDSFRVAQDTIGDMWISTVFLGLDHRFAGSGSPVVFETMVFSLKGLFDSDERMQRYCTFEEAERGHNEIVEILRQYESASQEITRETLARVRERLSANPGSTR